MVIDPPSRLARMPTKLGSDTVFIALYRAWQAPVSPPPRGGVAGRRNIVGAEPEVKVTIYFDNLGVVLVRCTRAVFGSSADARHCARPAARMAA